MVTEDEEFQRIAAQEFGEHWDPPTPEPPPAPDFHLDLYDDDESYRRVEADAWTAGPLARVGLGLIVVAVVIAILRLMVGPGWLGWLGGACVIGGLALIITQAVRSRPSDDGAAV